MSAPPAPAKSLQELGRLTALALRATLGNGFDPGSATAATRLLPELANSAERKGLAKLQDGALELVTYLSSFVDSRARPNARQLDQLRTLARAVLEQLRQHAPTALAPAPAPVETTPSTLVSAGTQPDPLRPLTGEQPSVTVPSVRPLATPSTAAPLVRPQAPPAAPPKPSTVLYVHGHEQSVRDLGKHLERRGLRLETVNTGEAVDDWIEQELPVAVLVDIDYFAALPEVIESVERGAGLQAMRIPVIALMPRTDMHARLSAAIGGADALLEAPDAAMVLARLDELLAPPEAEPYRVLIVDDDRQQSMYCEAVLKKKGMRTLTAPSAEVALGQIDSFQPELLLVDLHMPGVNGMELTARVREKAQAVLLPIIFLTGELETQTRFDALNVGGDDFFTKPIRPRHLATAVASRIKRARALRRQLALSLGTPRPGAAMPRGAFLENLRVTSELDKPAALLYIAIDQSKGLDDQLGMIARGELEQAVQSSVLEALKPTDAVTNWQDFCFLALLKRSQAGELLAAAERVRAQVAAKPFRLEGGTLPMTASIGYVERSVAAGDAERWLRAARAACQFAHRGGGHAVEVVPAVLPPGLSLDESFALRELLREPPSRQTVHLEYQPMIQLRGPHTGQYWSYLRLMAKQPGARGFQRSEYLQPARSAGVCIDLERYALQQAMEVIAEHGQRGRPLRLGSHCSAENLLNKLPQWLDATIGRESSWPGALILAFDAAELLALSAAQRSLIEALPRPGVRLMLCHYLGTPDQQRLTVTLPFTEVELAASWLDHARPDDDLKKLADVVAPLRKTAKSVIARELKHVALLSNLWAIGVDYIVADVMRAPGPSLDYDFAAGAAQPQ